MSLLGFEVVILAVVLGLAAWGYIRDLLSKIVIPTVRKYVSSTLADALATVVGTLDDVNCLATRTAKVAFVKAYNFLSKHLLMGRTLYIKIDSKTINVQTKIVTPLEGGEAEIRTFDNANIDWERLPPIVREKMINENVKVVELDFFEQLKAEIKEKKIIELLQ